MQQLENFEERENGLEEQLKKEVATKVNNFARVTLKGTELLRGKGARKCSSLAIGGG